MDEHRYIKGNMNDPKIISESKQEFNGVVYYLCGRYFQNKGKRLHREVWKANNGMDVPEGFHVHHVDHDRTNNAPDNLELMEIGEHMRLHGSEKSEAKTVACRRNVKFATEGNKLIPKEKRSEARRLAWEEQKKKPGTVKKCQFCGSEYETYIPKRSKYCHQNCKMKARTRRLQAQKGRSLLDCA